MNDFNPNSPEFSRPTDFAVDYDDLLELDEYEELYEVTCQQLRNK